MIEDADREERLHTWREYNEDQRDRNRMLVTSGERAVYAGMWINGGALALALAHLGSWFASAPGTRDAIGLAGFRTGMIYFIAGVLLSAIASGLSYIVNFCYISQAAKWEYSLTRPFIDASENTGKQWAVAGRILHVVTVAVVILCYASFAVGAWSVVTAVIPDGSG